MQQKVMEDARRPQLWNERHLTPKELGALWSLSHDSVIRLIRTEPGVLKSSPPHRRGARKRVTYRIPESVAARIHERLSIMR